MGVNVLIVEADSAKAFCQSLAARLAGEDRQILQADRLTEARKIIRRKNIDVVLLSLTTLRKEGLSILKTIKKVRPLTEVITINGSGQVTLSIESMKLGAFDDFMGPFNIESLVKRIHDASLRKKQREKKKKPLMERYMEIMSAGAFAEAGEQETALRFINKDRALESGTRKNREPVNKEK